MALKLTAIDDFVELTLEKIERGRYVDISLPLQKYHFASKWFNAKQESEEGGPRLQWKLRIANQGTAKFSGLFAVDRTARKNVMTHGHADWTKATVNYIYDIDEEAFQSGPETIIREMIVNEQGLLNDFFSLMETAMWSAPTSSTQEPMPLHGIPFWIQKNASEGFTGGDPSGFAAGAGDILTATYPNWKNYAGTYSVVSRDDLVEKIVNAMDYCYFQAPAKFPEIGGQTPQWGLYGVHSTLATMRRMLTAGNDNLGPDVARWAGEVLIKGVVFEWVPAVSNTDSDAYDSTAPVYGINWDTLKFKFKSGKRMLKYPPERAARQHTVRERHMDNWGNFQCLDRRESFVFYAA